MSDYKIVGGYGTIHLEEEVAKLIAEGYTPQGGGFSATSIHSTPRINSTVAFYQAMFKADEPKIELRGSAWPIGGE